MTTAITIGMIIIYVAIMMGIGVYTARQTRSVSDFVLGSHSVAHGSQRSLMAHLIFPPWYSSAMPDSSAGPMAFPPHGSA